MTWLMAFMGAGLMILAFQLYRLTIEQSTVWRGQAERNMLRHLPSYGQRGEIFDRQGRPLATSEPAFAAALIDQNPEHVAAILNRLSTILAGADPTQAPAIASEIKRRVAENNAAWRPYEPIIIARKLDLAVVTTLMEMRNELPGILVVAESARNYPHGRLAGGLLGHVGRLDDVEAKEPEFAGYAADEMVGKGGLEAFYEQTMHGSPGDRSVIIDPMGHPMGEKGTKPSTPGNNIYLALDMDLQQVAEEALARQIGWIKTQGDPHANPIRGALVAQDTRTGAILALASIPTYDPNMMVKGLTTSQWDELQRQPGAFLNYAIRDFSPGSTYKMATGLAGLEAGVIGPYEKVDCVDTYPKYTHPKNWNGAQGPTDIARALAISCNPFFYEVGDRLGIDRLSAFMDRVGFGHKTGIDLPGESPGVNPSRATYGNLWYDGTITSLAIGQGYDEVTPLQLAAYTGMIANNGVRWRPYLVSEVRSASGAVLKRTTPTQLPKLEAKAENWGRLQDGLRLAVTSFEGTAHYPFLGFPIEVAAKTGSAEVSSGYPDALAVAYAPYNHPEIAISVIIEGGSKGSWAAPVIRRVMAAYFHINDTYIDGMPTYRD